MDGEYRLYAQVIEAGSLSAAARALKLSPAMVSKRIARLEQRLGAKLIHRTTRRMSPTLAGQEFYERVVGILAASREAEAAVAGAGAEPSGRLRISAPTSFGRLHVAPHLADFLEAWPRLEVELILDDAYVDLVAGQVDLGIRIASAVGPGLTGRRLASNRRVLCASPGYLDRHGAPTSLAQLSDHRLLAAASQFPWRLQGRDGPVLVSGTSVVRTNSSEVVRELALGGAGIALRSMWDIARELEAGALQVVLPEHPGATDVGVFALYPDSRFTPAGVGAFIDHLAAAYERAETLVDV